MNPIQTQPKQLQQPDISALLQRPNVKFDMGEVGKWSCCNVGAVGPWDYGDYYAWGETEMKSRYAWETYKYCSPPYDDDGVPTCHNIGSDIAWTEYDVAHVKWGGNWHLPSRDQVRALVKNTKKELITIHGVEGLRCNAPNGNAIFITSAGYFTQTWVDWWVCYMGFWSSEPSTQFQEAAYAFIYDADYETSACKSFDREIGLSVRPVSK